MDSFKNIKKIVCMGDSLTEGDYGVFGKRCIANVQEKNYPYFLSKLTGCEVINLGKCGYTPSGYLELYKTSNIDFTDVDIVIVMLGTNGGLDYAEETQGDKDYAELIELIQNDAKCAEIIVCTPPNATVNKEMSNYSCADKVEKAVGFVRKFAKERGLKCIDVARCEYLTPENEYVTQPNDGLHFSEVGYGVMAMYIKDGLKKLL